MNGFAHRFNQHRSAFKHAAGHDDVKSQVLKLKLADHSICHFSQFIARPTQEIAGDRITKIKAYLDTALVEALFNQS